MSSAASEAPAPVAPAPTATAQPSVVGQVAQVLTTFGAPLTVATALLFYFGWVRTSVEATTLGVNDTIFGYSTQDYVMRSIDALFLPVLVASGLAIVALLAHGWL